MRRIAFPVSLMHALTSGTLRRRRSGMPSAAGCGCGCGTGRIAFKVGVVAVATRRQAQRRVPQGKRVVDDFLLEVQVTEDIVREHRGNMKSVNTQQKDKDRHTGSIQYKYTSKGWRKANR